MKKRRTLRSTIRMCWSTGVDVEQVVLHAPDDAPEHPQVAPQHRGLVHEPQRVGDAVGLPQDLHERARG
jgi:hypothetical protein